jgi:hypothetical protein
MPTPNDPQVTTETHCEWCGAPYEAPRPAEPKPAPHAPGRVAEYAPTHCEWCGAEYPEPHRPPHVRPPG